MIDGDRMPFLPSVFDMGFTETIMIRLIYRLIGLHLIVKHARKMHILL